MNPVLRAVLKPMVRCGLEEVYPCMHYLDDVSMNLNIATDCYTFFVLPWLVIVAVKIRHIIGHR